MAPRAFFIGVASGLFTAIGILHLGIYTELRVTKVRALEQMASVRSYFVALAKSFGMDIGQAVGTASAVSACPKFLERPSDDWYTLVLMTLVNAVAVAVYIGSLLFGIWPGWFSVHRAELAVIRPRFVFSSLPTRNFDGSPSAASFSIASARRIMGHRQPPEGARGGICGSLCLCAG